MGLIKQFDEYDENKLLFLDVLLLLNLSNLNVYIMNTC